MGAATDLSFSSYSGTTKITPSKDLDKALTTINITELSIPSTAENEDAKQPNSTLVLHPSLITSDMDALRFDAAAFSQLSHIARACPTEEFEASTQVVHQHQKNDNRPSENYSNLLISSPYNIPGHHLSLTALPLPSILFAKALTALRPIREDYATAPYTESLNFDTVLGVLRSLCTQPSVPTNSNTNSPLSTTTNINPSLPTISGAGSMINYPETSFYVVVFRSKLRSGIDKDWLFKLDAESHGEACESGGLLKYWFGKTSGDERNLATCFWHSHLDAQKGGQGPWHKKARAAGRELYEEIVFSTHRFTVLEGAKGYRFEGWRD